MWIYLNNAFLSIVQSQDSDPGVLLVRSRVRQDIENLFPDAEIVSTPTRDYPYRALVPVGKVKTVIANKILSINYDNFKSSVQDNHRHDVYNRVWSATRALSWEL